MPTLTIQLPGLSPVEHVLREDAITVGRMKGNTIALDDSSVSLSHAKVTRIGNEYFLKDLNSTNGTMLNGQSINEARLRDGDWVKFGEVVALFRAEASAAPTSPAMPVGIPVSQPVAQSVVSLPAAIAPAPARPAPGTIPPPVVLPGPTEDSMAADLIPRRKRVRKKNPFLLLVPVVGGISAACVVGFVIWKNIGRSESQAESVSPPPSAKPTPAKKPASKSTSVNRRAKPVADQPAPPPPPADPVLAAFLADIKSTDVVARRAAAQSISAIESGAKAAVPVLREALDDPDAEVRMWSALALVNNQTYDRATIPILVQVLKQENPALRQVACISLALMPHAEEDKAMVVPALQGLAAEDPRPEVRNDALTALKVIAPEAVKNK